MSGSGLYSAASEAPRAAVARSRLLMRGCTPDLADAVARFEDGSPTLFGQIEQYAGRSVNRVTQDIQAMKATSDVADILGLEEEDPVLLILRCYFDRDDQLFEISANYHPGERFTYSMHIEVD